jgi:hypothetical protein
MTLVSKLILEFRYYHIHIHTFYLKNINSFPILISVYSKNIPKILNLSLKKRKYFSNHHWLLSMFIILLQIIMSVLILPWRCRCLWQCFRGSHLLLYLSLYLRCAFVFLITKTKGINISYILKYILPHVKPVNF